MKQPVLLQVAPAKPEGEALGSCERCRREFRQPSEYTYRGRVKVCRAVRACHDRQEVARQIGWDPAVLNLTPEDFANVLEVFLSARNLVELLGELSGQDFEQGVHRQMRADLDQALHRVSRVRGILGGRS